MKKATSKLVIKTDKIVNLSAKQAQQIVGGGGYMVEKNASRNC
ncbi:MAG: class I lanthipeptide [Spirosomataceae bacterium]